MIYLDSAATSLQRPPEVLDAVLNAMQTCANLGRSGHKPAESAAEIAYNCRQEAGELFDCEPDQVVFTMNTTHGLNLAIQSIVHAGDQVVISGFEHNAVVRVLHKLKAEVFIAGIRLFDPDDTVSAFDRMITSETKAVICTHVSNVFGYILPIQDISEICYSRGVPLIIDAAQSAGSIPVLLRSLRASYIALPGHKGLLGPQGTGLLLCADTPEPLLMGGTGNLSKSLEMPTYLPERMEAGTQNMHGIAGLLEGIRFVKRTGLSQILSHERHLVSTLHGGIKDLVQTFYDTKGIQAGVLSFRAAGFDSENLASMLADRGFAVRAGLHCAPLAHRSAGTSAKGTVRVSFSIFNSEADVIVFTENLKEILIEGKSSARHLLN